MPILVLVVWEAVVGLGLVNPQVLPSPSSVVVRWYHYLLPLEAYDPATTSYWKWFFSGELIHDLLASLYRVAVGFFVGAGLALPLGLMMGASTHIYDYLNPLVQVVRPIPPIAFIPLAILWFGLGDPPAVFLISLGVFFRCL